MMNLDLKKMNDTGIKQELFGRWDLETEVERRGWRDGEYDWSTLHACIMNPIKTFQSR
jgi:hypothetical protein